MSRAASVGTPAPGREGATAAGVVIGVLGPTGVGKSAAAVAIARALGIRVISCDSMQVYRGFAVLTNQPTSDDLRAVEHALVGFVDPMHRFSAVEYAACARPLLAEDAESTGTALLCGGTGLYLRAAVAPLAVAPSDARVRTRLEERAAAEGVEALYAELTDLDPEAAAAVDSRNVRRVVRALEAVLAGKRPWSGREDLWRPTYDRPTLVVGLDLERAVLSQRIDRRARLMLEQGAVEEVRRFREQHGREATTPGGPGIRSAIGYREICRYLDRESTLNETAEQMATSTRRYARRQITWLRKVEGAVIIDVQGRDPEEIAREILDLGRLLNNKTTALGMRPPAR